MVDTIFPSHPKICHLGTRQIRHIWDSPCVIEEKIDGSQIAFGKINGELRVRSKGREIPLPAPPGDMFTLGIEAIERIADRIPEGFVFYGEYLRQPKHNTLAYKVTPTNYIVLFGGIGASGNWLTRIALEEWAIHLGFDVVPILGKTNGKEQVDVGQFLNKESYLGGTTIEGVVVKNYHDGWFVAKQVLVPITCGKFVTEMFKEKHIKNWKKENTSRGKFEALKEGFRTEARWRKAVQYLRDQGNLHTEPRDIGPLIKRVSEDVIEEEKENIKDLLWDCFGKEVIRNATRGLPQWYKEQLADVGSGDIETFEHRETRHGIGVPDHVDRHENGVPIGASPDDFAGSDYPPDIPVIDVRA